MKLTSGRRRLIGTFAAVCVAAVVLTVAPSAAHAHQAIVRGAAECDRAAGTWRITWTVENSERDIVGTLKEVIVTPPDRPAASIVTGAKLPFPKGRLVGVQTVPVGGARQASLRITVSWQRSGGIITKTSSASVDLAGDCGTPLKSIPTATLESACDGSVTAMLFNADRATSPARFTVKGAEGFSQNVDVKPGGSAVVSVPAANAGQIRVAVGEEEVTSGHFERPASCVPELPVTGASVGASVAAGTILFLLGAGLLVYLRRHRRHGVR